MSIDRPNYWIWQDANSNQSIASRGMNNEKSPLHGAALRAARSGRLLPVGYQELTYKRVLEKMNILLKISIQVNFPARFSNYS